MNEYIVRPSIVGDAHILGIPPGVFGVGVSALLLLLFIVTLVIALKERTAFERKLLNVLVILLAPTIGSILYYVLRYILTDKKKDS